MASFAQTVPLKPQAVFVAIQGRPVVLAWPDSGPDKRYIGQIRKYLEEVGNEPEKEPKGSTIDQRFNELGPSMRLRCYVDGPTKSIICCRQFTSQVWTGALLTGPFSAGILADRFDQALIDLDCTHRMLSEGFACFYRTFFRVSRPSGITLSGTVDGITANTERVKVSLSSITAPLKDGLRVILEDVRQSHSTSQSSAPSVTSILSGSDKNRLDHSKRIWYAQSEDAWKSSLNGCLSKDNGNVSVLNIILMSNESELVWRFIQSLIYGRDQSAYALSEQLSRVHSQSGANTSSLTPSVSQQLCQPGEVMFEISALERSCDEFDIKRFSLCVKTCPKSASEEHEVKVEHHSLESRPTQVAFIVFHVIIGHTDHELRQALIRYGKIVRRLRAKSLSRKGKKASEEGESRLGRAAASMASADHLNWKLYDPGNCPVMLVLHRDQHYSSDIPGQSHPSAKKQRRKRKSVPRKGSAEWISQFVQSTSSIHSEFSDIFPGLFLHRPSAHLVALNLSSKKDPMTVGERITMIWPRFWRMSQSLKMSLVTEEESMSLLLSVLDQYAQKQDAIAVKSAAGEAYLDSESASMTRSSVDISRRSLSSIESSSSSSSIVTMKGSLVHDVLKVRLRDRQDIRRRYSGSRESDGSSTSFQSEDEVGARQLDAQSNRDLQMRMAEKIRDRRIHRHRHHSAKKPSSQITRIRKKKYTPDGTIFDTDSVMNQPSPVSLKSDSLLAQIAKGSTLKKSVSVIQRGPTQDRRSELLAAISVEKQRSVEEETESDSEGDLLADDDDDDLDGDSSLLAENAVSAGEGFKDALSADITLSSMMDVTSKLQSISGVIHDELEKQGEMMAEMEQKQSTIARIDIPLGRSASEVSNLPSQSYDANELNPPILTDSILEVTEELSQYVKPSMVELSKVGGKKKHQRERFIEVDHRELESRDGLSNQMTFIDSEEMMDARHQLSMQRGESLDHLMDRSDDISVNSAAFYARAKRKSCNPCAPCVSCAKCCIKGTVLCCEVTAHECGRCISKFRTRCLPSSKETEKSVKAVIDNVFADLENVFYLMSQATSKLWPLCYGALANVLCILGLGLLELAVMVASVVLILPSCFVLLVVRMDKVETTSKNVGKRERVLESETCQQRLIRVIKQLFRATGMFSFLVICPILITYVIIPQSDYSQSVSLGMVSLYLITLLLLQAFGTYRALISFNQRVNDRAEKDAAKKEELQRKQTQSFIAPRIDQFVSIKDPNKPSNIQVINLTAQSDQSEKPEREVKAEDIEEEIEKIDAPPKYILNLGTLITIVMLFYEVFQMGVFASYVIGSGSSEDGRSSGNDDRTHYSGWKKSMMRVTYVSLDWVSANQLYMYSGFAITSVVCVMLVYICCFLSEVWNYANLRYVQNEREKAREYYFHSFIGTIVYGHGNLQSAGAVSSMVVRTLCDTLFVVICDKLVMCLACDGSGNLRIEPSVECWKDPEHRLLGTLCLICLAYYIPFSVMVAPMFVEFPKEEQSEDKTKEQGKKAEESVNSVSDGSDLEKTEEKDESEDGFFSMTSTVSFVKPYLSMVTLSKSAMLVGAQLVSQGKPTGTVLSQLLVCVSLFGITAHWSHQNLNIHRYDWIDTPVHPYGIAILKALAFFAGIIGCIVELMFIHGLLPRRVGGYDLSQSADMITLLTLMLIALSTAAGYWFRLRSEVDDRKSIAGFEPLLTDVDPRVSVSQLTQTIVFDPSTLFWGWS